MMSEKLCELASSGPEVGETMANENGGSGAGQKARRAARSVWHAREIQMELGGEDRWC